MKILHVISGLGPGGSEKILYDLVVNANLHKFEHIVLSLNDGGFYGAKLESYGIKVYMLGMNKFNGMIKFRKFCKIIKYEKPDIIQGWMYIGNFATCFVRLLGVKNIIWSVHNSQLDTKIASRKTLITNKLCCYLSHVIPKKIIFVADYAKKMHLKHGYNKKRSAVIYNGYDIQALTINKELKMESNVRLTENTLIIGWVGRFNAAKDIENFLQAVAIIKDSAHIETFVVLMVGMDITTENKQLMNLIDKFGVSDVVMLLGLQSNMSRVYNSFDILVLSSYTEAFPNVIAEAMACGIPCVATNVGDVAEIIGDNRFIVPAKNSKALADAVIELLSLSYVERVELGFDARARIVDNFSLSTMINHYEDLYDCLGNKKCVG